MKTHGPDDRDYYEIMGVTPTAKLPEITAAYHLLARRHHPDAGGTDATSLAKFKLINEAYEVLSDPRRRREYDRRRCLTRRTRSTGSQRPRESGGSPLSSGRPGPPSAWALPERGTELELPITPEEARCGGPCDLVLSIPSVCQLCHGGQRLAGVACPQCQGHGEVCSKHRLNIDLPPGLRTGALIRLTGLDSQASTLAGSLFLRILIRPSW